MTKLVFIHVPIRNMYFLSGMEGFKKSEGRSTRGASSLQNWLRPPPQNWMRPYDSCSSAPTALMKKLSTANLLSIHVLILRIFVFGGATRIVGAGSRQSQIGLSKGVLSANPLPGASGLGKLTNFDLWSTETHYKWKSFYTDCPCLCLYHPKSTQEYFHADVEFRWVWSEKMLLLLKSTQVM